MMWEVKVETLDEHGNVTSTVFWLGCPQGTAALALAYAPLDVPEHRDVLNDAYEAFLKCGRPNCDYFDYLP